MEHFDPTAVSVVFVVMVPIVAGFTLIAHRLKLQQEQFRMVMEERKLLIEKGATDLPPVRLPNMSRHWRDRFHHLRVGVVFTLVAVTAGVYAVAHAGVLSMFDTVIPNALLWIVGAIGVAHLVLYFLRESYDRQHPPQDRDMTGNGYGDTSGRH